MKRILIQRLDYNDNFIEENTKKNLNHQNKKLKYCALFNLFVKLIVYFSMFFYTNRFCYIFVKINSKYKEDDFSDSNAVDFSLDVCVLKIYFLHVVPACQTPLLLPPPFYRSQPRQSAMKTQDINNSVSTLAPP